MNHRVPANKEIQGDAARRGMLHLLGLGKIWGILAYAEDTCVGWAAIDPILNQPGHDYNAWTGAEKAETTWSIHCLFVHPKFRGKGLSGRLIHEAVSLAQTHGAKRVLAFPIPTEKRHHFPEHDGEFSGRLSSYQKLGFRELERINDFYQVVSKDLAP